MKLVIIDPGSGNLASVLRAFQKVAAESGIAAEISVTRDAAEVVMTTRAATVAWIAFVADVVLVGLVHLAARRRIKQGHLDGA